MLRTKETLGPSSKSSTLNLNATLLSHFLAFTEDCCSMSNRVLPLGAPAGLIICLPQKIPASEHVEPTEKSMLNFSKDGMFL